MDTKILSIDGVMLNTKELYEHIEKFSFNHLVTTKSDRVTYPVPRLIENYNEIKEIYNLLNEHVKLKISIHPAGEWLLDNFYIIEEVTKSIQKELTLSKYTNFVGISKGKYKGFARIYVLASEIVNYTDNKIDRNIIENSIRAYQTKKNLSMDEIWNIGIFMQIAIIENIRQIVETIFISQIEKYKVESIIERLVDTRPKNEYKFTNIIASKDIRENSNDVKYPFVEYLSYKLKKYGKKTQSFLNILEEEVEKSGSTVSEIIKREHFDIAVRKISIGNCITSIKKVQRINYLEIFERINSVEEILRQDPADVYNKMNYNTKEYYRNKIKEIAKKTKISEIYISKKILELAQTGTKGNKDFHIGYYLQDENIDILYKKLQFKVKKQYNNNQKSKIYIASIYLICLIVSIIIARIYPQNAKNMWIRVGTFLLIFIPISEIVIQLIQYILSKIVKPKIIPKLDFYNGVPKDEATFIIIPTILDSKKKVIDMFRNLEVDYLSNKSDNLYFCLLGDCKESKKEYEEYDNEIVEIGIKEQQRLNQKYKNDDYPRFHFIYRNRIYNKCEEKYLGWERKRGAITLFSKLLDGKLDGDEQTKHFKANTVIKDNLPKIKYIITLDSDTDLSLCSAFELIGAMAHILNKPEIKDKKVVSGYGLIQPRVGINLDISYKTLFTKIFAGSGGTDLYSNAISDIYQDNFGEGIFTGKGIFDIKAYNEILDNEIPENLVLSHDLLEGSYLRCALATDILLMDGYPCKYSSFMERLSRWIRGDWQIIMWLKSRKLNLLSKYKIFDNLRRSLFEISSIIAVLYFIVISKIYNINFCIPILIVIFSNVAPFILEIINIIVFKKEGEQKQVLFSPRIAGIKGAICRGIITIGCVFYKAYISCYAIIKTMYRLFISKKHLLEWVTSEEAEKKAENDIFSYYKKMFINIIIGITGIVYFYHNLNVFGIVLGFFYMLIPMIMWYISKEFKIIHPKDKLNNDEIKYLEEVGNKTFKFFLDNLHEKNNYLIPDNYQEERKNAYVDRTSSTNIGLALMAVQAGCDLGYIDLRKANELIINIINTIKNLKKWNGHLYNWYNIKTKEPLIPMYVSTVDSGNLVGYLYVTKIFLEKQEDFSLKNYINDIDELIENTDFSKLYSKEHRLFSIGFNIEENSLTDSYYDLLASEARQASFIAIAKKDVDPKHWNYLSRTLTVLNNRKGLISWSGTAFEYLMPNINMPRFKGSLIDESVKFAIMSQIEYAKVLGVPWGISESAFSVKDLKSNYQYKAFGIPWLGLKRGLADEAVVSSYASVLALEDKPKEVINNLKVLEELGMYDKYGFYESIDFSAQRLSLNEELNIVKTYMAHHQALILLSINNLINNNIFQKRFIENPEIEATAILLQEKMPETYIVTKEQKEKPERPKYRNYENYSCTVLDKIDERMIRSNVISNGFYTIAINQKGLGFSKFNDIYVNRFKVTDDYNQGILLYVKDVDTKEILTVGENNSQVLFMPDQINIEKKLGDIKTKLKITVDQEEAIEIRSLLLENRSSEDKILEVSACFEPVISTSLQDYAHPAFNNLFLSFDYDEEFSILEVMRKSRDIEKKEIFLEIAYITDAETLIDNEFEIDKEKVDLRTNLGIPEAIQKSLPFSKKLGLTVDPMVNLRKTIKLYSGEKKTVNLIMSIGYNKLLAKENLNKYKNLENIKRSFEIARAKAEAEMRYLNLNSKEVNIYQKVLGYILFDNPIKQIDSKKIEEQLYNQSDLWQFGISGDLKIILVKIRDCNDIYVIKQVLKMYEFFRSRNINVDLVLLDEENHSYENFIREEIENQILDRHLAFLRNVRGGIYILAKNELSKKEISLLEFLSCFTIDTHKGDLRYLIKDKEEEYLEKYKEIPEEYIVDYEEQKNYNQEINLLKNENNKYNNEYGAFSPDGKEYRITINKEKRLPTVWSHIIANEKFGILVTENMGGYSWYKNSRLNRVTAWSNKAFMDIPSEVIYMEDLKTSKKWSLGFSPMPDDSNYNIIYGFGYAKYLHECLGITQEFEIFVPKDETLKIGILKLNNNTIERKKLKIVYYIKPVLGEDEIKTLGTLKIDYDKMANIVFAENLYSSDIGGKMYVSASEEIKSFTGDKKFFLGNGGISNPDGLRKVRLNNNTAFGQQNCIAIELEVDIDSMSMKEIVLNLGVSDSYINAKNTAYKYSKIQNCTQELEKVKKMWREKLEKLQIFCETESLNIMLNGWAMYQTISSRLYGRTGYYQSGGAYGFRDQLQDVLCLKYIDSEMVKSQILLHSKHQFIEGDVEHWWHEETNKGIRTRFSDDLLWIVYLVVEYIETTGDKTILDVKTNYLQGEVLKQCEEERYDKYLSSDIEETIYMHCIRAIEKSMDFGEHGLPKIGTGDWNDGFSTVGNKGKGESVWLGFFMYNIISRFIQFIEEKEGTERKNKYTEKLKKLKENLNTHAWDGRWFRRAFTDDGNILGSIENDECRIDSIAQSWAIISNVAEEEKQKLALESLENHLVDTKNGIIKLLDPAFVNGKLQPGYIKAYLPGVRENGGQYTHAAIWAIIAEAIRQNGDKAVEFLKMITPIEHSRTKEQVNKYKVEPYVIAADIYGASNLLGRGGWTWYTGSSSWYYKAAIEYVFGLKIMNKTLTIKPCIPKEWREYSIRYKYGRSVYNIKILNPNKKNTGITTITINGIINQDNKIKLVDDGRIFDIIAEM